MLQLPIAAPPRPVEGQAVSASGGGLGAAMPGAASALVEAAASLGPRGTGVVVVSTRPQLLLLGPAAGARARNPPG